MNYQIIGSTTNGKLALLCTCPFCGDKHIVTVKPRELKAYEGGELVQDAFPMLNRDEREMIMTGICPKCRPAE